MKRKMLPLLFMLTAGAITVIITFLKQYPLQSLLLALLIVMTAFYLLGLLIKNMLDYFEKQNAKKAAAEGEVVEKEPDAAEKETGEKTKEET